jgi:hypothetical protein
MKHVPKRRQSGVDSAGKERQATELAGHAFSSCVAASFLSDCGAKLQERPTEGFWCSSRANAAE